MSLFNKLFSIKKDRFHYIVRFLGIKFKVRSLKLTNNVIKSFREKTKYYLMNSRQRFLWENESDVSVGGLGGGPENAG